MQLCPTSNFDNKKTLEQLRYIKTLQLKLATNYFEGILIYYNKKRNKFNVVGHY